MKSRASIAAITLSLTALQSLYGGMFESDMLESGMLYRVRMEGKLPCEYLQVTMESSPSDFRPDKQRLAKVLLLAADKKTVLQRITDITFDGCTAEQDDFNFDGYRDFRSFLWQESGSGGHFYRHFVFDPKIRRYVSCRGVG